VTAVAATTAIVLTAGLATRLHPLSYVRAKGSMPVAGEPLVRRILRWLGDGGVRSVILNLHHRPETITAAVGDGSDVGLTVRYSWEPRILGSAGGPRRALGLVDDTRVWIVNGDTLTDVDLGAMERTHQESGALVTMALVPNPAPHRYGGVRADADGSVLGFCRPGQDASAGHFIGVQLVERAVFDELADGVPAESVGAVYPALIAANPRAVRAFMSAASFRDVGTPASYWATSLSLAGPAGSLIGTRAHVAPTASVERTILWDDVVVEDDVSLRDCVVADGVRVPRGLRMERVAIVRAGDAPAEVRGPRDGGLIIEPLGL